MKTTIPTTKLRKEQLRKTDTKHLGNLKKGNLFYENNASGDKSLAPKVALCVCVFELVDHCPYSPDNLT